VAQAGVLKKTDTARNAIRYPGMHLYIILPCINMQNYASSNYEIF